MCLTKSGSPLGAFIKAQNDVNKALELEEPKAWASPRCRYYAYFKDAGILENCHDLI